MVSAESRVQELEESLAQFIEDFELLNSDLTICAQKLAQAESRIEVLEKRNEELEQECSASTGKVKDLTSLSEQLTS